MRRPGRIQNISYKEVPRCPPYFSCVAGGGLARGTAGMESSCDWYRPVTPPREDVMRLNLSSTSMLLVPSLLPKKDAIDKLKIWTAAHMHPMHQS